MTANQSRPARRRIAAVTALAVAIPLMLTPTASADVQSVLDACKPENKCADAPGQVRKFCDETTEVCTNQTT